ncbi:hypothetical protein M405DRAFT_560398 [Rhizopogon salebrosus TDB-379]|nr:hypothetical protein M405DRAFT_560398 [Rhizopogon salebrosus TDB-379]
MGRAGAGCAKLNGLLVSAALLPAFAGPKLNEDLTAGGAGEGVPNANDFFSAGVGGAGVPNEKGAGTDNDFSSAGAVLGRALSEKPGVVDVPCVPNRGLGASITGAGVGTRDVEGAGGPNEKALFDGSVIAGTDAGCPKENAGLDGSAAGAETTGVPKLNGAAGGAAPKREGGSRASGSVTFEVSTTGGEAPNENGKEATGRGATTADGTGDPSTGARTSLGGAGAPNDTPVVVAEVPKIEELVDAGDAPNRELATGAADDAAVA